MKNSCIRSGFLRQILIWLTVQTSQYVFFEEKASRTRGDHLWQSYSFICEYMGLVFAFLKLPVILFSKLELVRWNLAESRKVFPNFERAVSLVFVLTQNCSRIFSRRVLCRWYIPGCLILEKHFAEEVWALFIGRVFSKGRFQVRGSPLRYGCSVMAAACGGKKIDNRDIGRWMRWALLSSWKVSCGWSGIGCKKRGLILRENGGICVHCA